jgi:hypothetical protein
LIEATETGGRALIPYRWEQIGSKRVTSSRLQRRSPGLLHYAIGAQADGVPDPKSRLEARRRRPLGSKIDQQATDQGFLVRIAVRFVV